MGSGLNLGLGLSGAAGGALETAQTGLRERLLIAQQALDEETRRAQEERLAQAHALEIARVRREEARARAASLQGLYSNPTVTSATPTVAGVGPVGAERPPETEGDLAAPGQPAPVRGVSA